MHEMTTKSIPGSRRLAYIATMEEVVMWPHWNLQNYTAVKSLSNNIISLNPGWLESCVCVHIPSSFPPPSSRLQLDSSNHLPTQVVMASLIVCFKARFDRVWQSTFSDSVEGLRKPFFMFTAHALTLSLLLFSFLRVQKILVTALFVLISIGVYRWFAFNFPCS